MGGDLALSMHRGPQAVHTLPMTQGRKLLLLAVASAFALGALAIAAGRVDAAWLLRDPNAHAHAHPLTGSLSTLTVWLWVASATVCLAAPAQAAHPSLLRSAGAISLYLAVDDAFQIHEDLAQRYLGLPEKAVLGLLALAICVHLWSHRRALSESTDRRCLLLSLAALAGSVAVDLLESWFWHLGPDGHMLLEDSLKAAGALFWLCFHLDLSRSRSQPG
ncbi:MAG: hypothetical protein U1E77_22135 [Inhella sp.]